MFGYADIKYITFLNRITEATNFTERHKYFPQGPHVTRVQHVSQP